MPKKRKTKQEKIILQLKRELARQKSAPTAELGTKIKTRQEAIFKAQERTVKADKTAKSASKSIFFYSPRLVKKDLLKSLALTLIVISLEIVLYLRLR